ncbi:MAG TPA: hypothetical protein VFT99_07095, partial [Roseiflexaceae bacterium]|nr:hypothetical protein [Roseiflexaceae bacterium]
MNFLVQRWFHHDPGLAPPRWQKSLTKDGASFVVNIQAVPYGARQSSMCVMAQAGVAKPCSCRLTASTTAG